MPEVPPAVEVGWRLGRSYWGQGLATEAPVAAVRFGFEDRGLKRIVSIRVRLFELKLDQYVTTTR
ncbi:GNAT family N-acetyltransferase [Streptomyces sp. NPDC002889]|uniref:GNAT family N-acetyltransferase n=1 Tax=Streptomyces sp. NPDC002889 TaxID=3364669 RepID=UPI0036B9B652